MANKELTHINRIRGNTQTCDNYTGVDGEFIINRDTQSIRIHDNKKKGGYGTIDAMHYPDALPEQVPTDLRTGAHVTAGSGRLEGGDAPHAEELAGDGLIARGGTLNVDVDNLANVVHKTGNETVAGVKTFSSNARIVKSDPSLQYYNTNYEKGVATASTATHSYPLNFYDKNGKTLADIETQYGTDKSTKLAFRVHNFNSAESTGYTFLQVGIDKDGNPTTSAPTPPDNSNSSNIATTAWIRKRLGNGLTFNSKLNTITTSHYYKAGNLNIYVSKTGNDSNDGLSSATAVATISRAITIINNTFFAGGSAVIFLGEGTWNESINSNYVVTTPYVTVYGSGMDKTTIVSANASTFSNLTLKDLTLTGEIQASSMGRVVLNGNIKITNAAVTHREVIDVNGNSMMVITGDLYIAAPTDFTRAWAFRVTQSSYLAFTSANVRISGAFDIVMWVDQASAVYAPSSAVFSGNPTGKRFQIQCGSSVYTAGRGVNFIPGSAAGGVDAATFGSLI